MSKNRYRLKSKLNIHYMKSHHRTKLRRDAYKMLSRLNSGSVPCYVCGDHVLWRNATLEHIVPLSKGGSDQMPNLGISHYKCNERRGNLSHD